jgi:hypothetical protein
MEFSWLFSDIPGVKIFHVLKGSLIQLGHGFPRLFGYDRSIWDIATR